MVEHLRVLLEGIGADPERASPSCRCWRAAERQQVLVEWNDTRGGVPAEPLRRTALFEAQAARTPDAAALVFDGRAADLRASWTRAPTSWRTTCARWASGPEVLVGLCLERSLELVVGVLGILKAGGAYVPLDPSYPRGAPGLHAAGRRRPGAASPQETLAGRAARAAGAARVPGLGVGTHWPGMPEHDPAPGAAPEQPGLRHLHLGLDRAAQGRRC